MGSYANPFDATFIESMYQKFQDSPGEMEPSWRHFFEGVQFAALLKEDVDAPDHDYRIFALIRAYRKWGHRIANLNPLAPAAEREHELDLEQFGLAPEDLARQVSTMGVLPQPKATIGELIAALKQIYCGPVGVEYLHGADPETEAWFKGKIEQQLNQPNLNLEEKTWILSKLNQAELFERFLHTKYVGQKRFSLEGAEALIPCLAEILEALAEHGGDEVVVGMSHRGRLNVLANLMGKTFEELFSEFEPNYLPHAVQGGGDVKYHKGFESTYRTRTEKEVQVSLADNPSHLEAVCPVVQGLVRAHQSLRHDENRSRIIPVLIHGDASFAGQGIVSETLNMSQLEGFHTGGTIHIIVNNQIGFTTNPSDARSTPYASDVARQILAPVFHVNGDYPESLVHVARLASQFRQKFHRDVVIDLICYRRHGHNEGDEPSFTQPVMYRKIRKHPSPREVYSKQLIAQGTFEAQVAEKMEAAFSKALEESLALARSGKPISPAKQTGPHYQTYRHIEEADLFESVDTAVSQDKLEHLSRTLNHIPEGFSANRKVARVLNRRLDQVRRGEGIDWGCAEHLAFATLLNQGIPCRMTGQDVLRGTFSHRHAVLFDVKTGEPYTPLAHVADDGARFSIYNSHLSELAVLGFEFGYTLAQPKSLVIWEAQFGDFCNGAQTIIDQFLASSEAKWQRISNLVLFLPHGYEGQGPEHSSARLERFLQLCGQSNMQVANLTEPGQLFHILRRQVLRSFRKPLILMTPKSLLRHAKCVSSLSKLTDGRFNEILDDDIPPEGVTKLVFCSGKVYFDLVAAREDKNAQSVALVRIEQLYPLALDQIRAVVARYKHVREYVWAQEEPRNMGAWHFIYHSLEALLDTRVSYVGRPESASPAAGSLSLHQREQATIINQIFDDCRQDPPAGEK